MCYHLKAVLQNSLNYHRVCQSIGWMFWVLLKHTDPVLVRWSWTTDHCSSIQVEQTGTGGRVLVWLCLRQWGILSSLILTARFHSRHINISVVVAYAPTEDAADGVKDEFYQQLLGTFDELPGHDVKFLLGDDWFNNSLVSSQAKQMVEQNDETLNYILRFIVLSSSS